MISDQQKLEALVIDVQDDSQEWLDIPGEACIRLAKQIGPPAIFAVSALLTRTRDNHVALNCVRLLARVTLPAAHDALAAALDLALADEVREQIFEDALDSAALRSHEGFVSKARALYPKWPHTELASFLASVRQLGKDLDAATGS